LSKQNYQVEVEREQNYKQFFKEFDHNLAGRMSSHMKHVTEPIIEKQLMLDDIEEKNELERNKYLDKKDLRERTERFRQEKEMHEQNRLVFEKKERERTNKRENYQNACEQRKKEEDDYKAAQQRRLEDEEDRRHLYRQALQFQTGYQEYSKNKNNQMTQMEKKLNNIDHKQATPIKTDYQGMVPGIHNLESVGSRPLLRKANDDYYASQSTDPKFLTRNDNRSTKNLRSKIKPLEDFAHIGTPLRTSNKYNTITNPIPFVNQNPYIVKEKTMIGGNDVNSLIRTSSMGRLGRSLLSSTAEKNILI
jgi:hypothetical protein